MQSGLAAVLMMENFILMLSKKQVTKYYDKIDIKPYERTDDIVVT